MHFSKIRDTQTLIQLMQKNVWNSDLLMAKMKLGADLA
jgi:hypothetical protein